MPWQNIFMTMNTIDTFAGVLFLVGSWLGFRAWWRERRRQKEVEEEDDHVGCENPPCHEGCYICKVLQEMKKDGDDD